MTIKRFIIGLMVGYAVILFASNAKAEPLSVKALNEQVDQTNFIVGNHCSGTLISTSERLILTNNHCVEMYVSKRTKEIVKDGEVKKILVEEWREATVSQKHYTDYKLVGQTTLQANVVARWRESDLALIQIKAKSITNTMAVPIFGGTAYRGEKVYAVGNPHMLDATISSGILSNLNREIRVSWADGQPVQFLQTTAPIAGGSSGGSLINEHGELLGVPAAGTSSGDIGLAIPFFKVREFLKNECYESVYNPEAPSYDECVKAREKDAEEE